MLILYNEENFKYTTVRYVKKVSHELGFFSIRGLLSSPTQFDRIVGTNCESYCCDIWFQITFILARHSLILRQSCRSEKTCILAVNINQGDVHLLFCFFPIFVKMIPKPHVAIWATIASLIKTATITSSPLGDRCHSKQIAKRTNIGP
jgi:hypothetical protein